MQIKAEVHNISTVIGQFAASLTLEVNSSYARDKYPFTAASRFFFFFFLTLFTRKTQICL